MPQTGGMARFSDTALRRAALALFVGIVTLDVTFIAAGSAIEGDPGLTYPESGLEEGEAVGIAVFAVVGLLLTWMRPRNPIGSLLAASGLSLAACDAGEHLAR